jgi:hypothetical protein
MIIEDATAKNVGDRANGQGGLNNYPCGEAVGMTAWLNVPAVQAAMHVSIAHRPDGKWSPSTGLNFTHTQPTLLHMYPRLIEKLRILLFSGDVDECVPYNGAEQWTRGFGYAEAEHWHPWLLDSTVAGYVVVALSLEAVLARGMMEEHACTSPQHTSISIIPLTTARVHLHHTSRLLSLHQLLTV